MSDRRRNLLDVPNDPWAGAVGVDMTRLHEYVCWSPAEDSDPVRLTAATTDDAAKIFVLRGQSTGVRHDNTWSPEQVLVVDYDSGGATWVTVKVTIEAT